VGEEHVVVWPRRRSLVLDAERRVLPHPQRPATVSTPSRSSCGQWPQDLKSARRKRPDCDLRDRFGHGGGDDLLPRMMIIGLVHRTILRRTSPHPHGASRVRPGTYRSRGRRRSGSKSIGWASAPSGDDHDLRRDEEHQADIGPAGRFSLYENGDCEIKDALVMIFEDGLPCVFVVRNLLRPLRGS